MPYRLHRLEFTAPGHEVDDAMIVVPSHFTDYAVEAAVLVALATLVNRAVSLNREEPDLPTAEDVAKELGASAMLPGMYIPLAGMTVNMNGALIELSAELAPGFKPKQLNTE